MTGPLLGRGVLAIWNGIAPGQDAEFLRWHVAQHIPERLSVPGFLRARRYVALEGTPRYFNFYEVDGPEVLSSEAYLARLNDPTDWTRRVVPHFIDTSRTLCRVVQSLGHGIGGTMATLRLDAPADTLRPVQDLLAQTPDISGVHLLARAVTAASGTRESAMRAQPDGSSATILLIEGAAPAAVKATLDDLLPDDKLRELTGGAAPQRGLYQLDFLMDRSAA